MCKNVAAVVSALSFTLVSLADEPKSAPADPAEIERLVKEIEASPLPPNLLRGDGLPSALARQPYDAASLKPYLVDRVSAVDILAEPDKHPLASAAIQAGERLRKLAKGEPARFQMEFRSPITPMFKKQVQLLQRGPARALAELDDIAELLEKATEKRKSERSPRWQAHFDLLQARLNLWRVAVHEYDLLLGQIRKDELPELDAAKNNNGWRIVAAEKIQSSADVRRLAKDAVKHLSKVEADYPGTPWATLAKQDQTLQLGLEWQPAKLPMLKK